MPLYISQHLPTGAKRLLQADNMARALRHVSTEFVISKASPVDAHELAVSGIKIEQVAADGDVPQ